MFIIKLKQTYRLLPEVDTTSAPGGVSVVPSRGTPTGVRLFTVDGIDGDTIQGTSTGEDGAGGVAVEVLNRRDLENGMLIHDPDWETHRVAVILVADAYWDELNKAMLPVGTWAGSGTVPTAKGPILMAWWDVVAPSAADAVVATTEAIQHQRAADPETAIHVRPTFPE